MKKTLSVLFVLILACSFVFAGGAGETGTSAAASSDTKTVKVGLICIGDENDQGYTYNFIRGRDEATQMLADEGINVEWMTIYNIGEDASCIDANIEAAEEGCQIIINNSYGFEPFMLEVVDDYPEIEFISCTNCASVFDGRENTHNAFANIYEGRYIAGVVAGLKLQQMIDEGQITPEEAVIGYVGAFSFAEVISGFTSYFLGARSVCPSVTMKVSFVGSWSDATAESDAALALIDEGCIMISQHSDNTTPATAAQSRGVFHTGYNNDMTGIAPDASLIGTRIDWGIYFTEAIRNYVNGEPLAIQKTFIPLTIFPDIETIDVGVFSLYEAYRLYGRPAASAVERLDMVELGTRDAHLLNMEEGAPAISYECMSFDEKGTPIEYVSALRRGDRGGYTITFLSAMCLAL